MYMKTELEYSNPQTSNLSPQKITKGHILMVPTSKYTPHFYIYMYTHFMIR